MAQNTRDGTVSDAINWLEIEIGRSRDDHAKLVAVTDQVQRQIHDLLDQIDQNERLIRGVEPRFVPLKGIPEKIGMLDESIEHLRYQITTQKAEIDNAIRLLQAEAEYDREERADALRRINVASDHLSAIASNVAQVQAQAAQATQAASTIIERQREVEDRVQQFGLRLDRSIEVHRDLEERVRNAVIQGVEDRLAVVFERLQLIGEMVQRTERTVEGVAQERSLRHDVLEQVGLWRDQNTRLESRVAAVEEIADRVLTEVDKLHGELALIEGRHAGLGERVAGIRRDIAEVVDHVRDEFAKYNQMSEKQRRKQIQVLEQVLREMKFHAFRPPEEP
jgi:methyl-accepting chemotaxis protein